MKSSRAICRKQLGACGPQYRFLFSCVQKFIVIYTDTQNTPNLKGYFVLDLLGSYLTEAQVKQIRKFVPKRTI